MQVVDTRFISNVAELFYEPVAFSAYGRGGAVALVALSKCRIGTSLFDSNELVTGATNLNSNDSPALSGGGLYIEASSCLLFSSAFANNSIQARSGEVIAAGGAATFETTEPYTPALIHLSGCQFTGNHVMTKGSVMGGALAVIGVNLTVDAGRGPSHYSANFVNTTCGPMAGECYAFGGALYHQGSRLDVAGTTFDNNYVTSSQSGTRLAATSGGAVYSTSSLNHGYWSTSFRSTSFTHNRALATVHSSASAPNEPLVGGGALSVNHNYPGAFNASTCVFSWNSASLNGTSTVLHNVGGGKKLYRHIFYHLNRSKNV